MRKSGCLLLYRFSLGLLLVDALLEDVMPFAQGLDLVQRFLPCLRQLYLFVAQTIPGTELGQESARLIVEIGSLGSL